MAGSGLPGFIASPACCFLCVNENVISQVSALDTVPLCPGRTVLLELKDKGNSFLPEADFGHSSLSQPQEIV